MAAPHTPRPRPRPRIPQVPRERGVARQPLRRRDAQAKLPAGEATFVTAFDHSPLALTITSLDTGRFIDVNDAFVGLSGYARDEVIGRTPDDLKLWVDPRQRADGLAQLRAGTAVHDVEARFRMKNGDVRVGVIGSAVVRTEGRAAVLSTVLDITARKQTEALLVEQTRLVELIASGRPLDECLTALCATVPKLSPHARACVLLTDGVRRTCSRAIAPDLAPTWRQGLAEVPIIDDVAIGSEAGRARMPVTWTDVATDTRCSRVWRDLCVSHGVVAGHATPIFDADGRSCGAFLLCFDEPRPPNDWELRLAEFGAHVASIALERDRSTIALRESHRALGAELAATQHLQEISLQLVQEENVDALYEQVLDAASAIMRSEYASIQMLHPERGQGGELRLLGARGFNPEACRFWEWVRPASESTCGLALRTGRRVIVSDVTACDFMAGSADLAAYLQTGIHAVQTTPLMSRSGRLVGMISTHWRQPHEPAERDLRLLDLLARQAADLIERTQAGAALRENERRLLHADRLKDEFLATLSHELRTPLNAVIGWAHMLRTGTIRDDMVEHALVSLERNARAQMQLVDDLLDVSRIISGTLRMASEPVELGPVVAGAVDTVRPTAAAKGITLRIGGRRDRSARVTGDADRLKQVVWNLLSNAIKFTPVSGRVDVMLRRRDTDVQIVVRDTGEGIAPEFLPLVFERFRQQDGAVTRRHGGLGLGLAIVRHLTEAHGGTISAASAGLGTGSTFTVCLPALATPATRPDAPLSRPRRGARVRRKA